MEEQREKTSKNKRAILPPPPPPQKKRNERIEKNATHPMPRRSYRNTGPRRAWAGLRRARRRTRCTRTGWPPRPRRRRPGPGRAPRPAAAGAAGADAGRRRHRARASASASSGRSSHSSRPHSPAAASSRPLRSPRRCLRRPRWTESARRPACRRSRTPSWSRKAGRRPRRARARTAAHPGTAGPRSRAGNSAGPDGGWSRCCPAASEQDRPRRTCFERRSACKKEKLFLSKGFGTIKCLEDVFFSTSSPLLSTAAAGFLLLRGPRKRRKRTQREPLPRACARARVREKQAQSDY